MALRRRKKEFRSDSSSCFCTDLSDAREQETLWLHDMFLLMIMQSTELASGSQGFLENPADCPKYSVVHVERELSFWNLPCPR